MKRILYFAACCGLFWACSEDDRVIEDASGLVGSWVLFEQLADPGDGSGVFRPVVSSKRVTFAEDGTYEANGSLCNMDTQVGGTVSGSYQIANDTLTQFSIDNFLTPTDCFSDELKVFITVEDDNLILSYLCIEPCQQKYRKL
ncbi:hypothetical protein ABV409_11825 [Flagellimonas sp. DF-77]|uniref:hypothetical protein n=1 Tax=Flagellimonas algarum TaxID=3230298 RepID=UPI0033988DD1